MTEHAIQNAQSWWETIRDQIAAYDAVEDDDVEEAMSQRIEESALSVRVRDGWRQPGSTADGADEYEILLSTGGPALRIYGRLDRHGAPDLDPMLQWQDWGTPWTDFWPPNSNDIPYKETLRRWTEFFYFGEG